MSNTVVQGLLLLIGAYLIGSIPSAYLAGRWLRGVDVRDYGTGSVGGSNVFHNVAHWATVPVGIFDIGKATFVTWLALYPLDLGYGWAVAVGLCAMIGHSWSIYLGFTGGRGIGCILGTLLIVFPWAALFVAVVMFLGWRLGRIWASSAALLVVPLLCLASDQPAAVTWGAVGMIILTAIKRLEANRQPLPDGPERKQVILRRLWLDRDIASHEEWVARRQVSAVKDGSVEDEVEIGAG